MLEQKEIAKRVLCNMFNIKESDIVFMRSRKFNINEARRYYMYYLFWHKKVKHNHMKEHVFGVHHTTSMHHVKRMRDMIENYSDIRERFIYFIFQTDMLEWEKMKTDKIYTMNELLKPLNIIKNEN
jgi:chromosomal replication initiation ATPase DnaA